MDKHEESGRKGASFGGASSSAGLLEPPIRKTVLPAQPGLHYGFVVLGLIVLAVFVALGLGRHGYTFILPAMQDSLKLSNSQTGELQSWNLTGYMLTVVFAGVLATRFGPRLVISIALVVSACGLALTGLVPTFEGARWGRFLAGVGGAAGNVPAMALVSAWFGVKRRGLASGAAVGGSSVGLMVTGPLVPAVLHRYGTDAWPLAWCLLAGMGVCVAVLCGLFLRNRPEEQGLAPLGETAPPATPANTGGRVSTFNWSLIYRSGVLWHLAAIYFAFGFSYVIYSTFFARYLVKEAHFTMSSAGWLWMKVGMISGISGFIWGSISDRWGRRTALLGVYVLQGFSFLLFGLTKDWALLYVSAGLFAMTAWSIPALMAALCGDIFGARLAPAALGLMTIVFGAAQAIAPSFAGHIADAQQSFAPAFVTAGLVALILGAGGTWLLKAEKLGQR